MISTKETMLNPRKRPKSPPSEAMKSTGPILMLLSNSKVEVRFYADDKTFLTHDSLLAEKDVDNGDILLPGVVEVLPRGNEREITTKLKVEISHRGLSD